MKQTFLRPLAAVALLAAVGATAAQAANSIRVPNGKNGATTLPGHPTAEGASACSGSNLNFARFGQGCGALVTLDSDTASAYVQDNSPSGEATYRVRFMVDARRLTMPASDSFDLFVAYDGVDPAPPATTGAAVLRAIVTSDGTDRFLNVAVLDDSNATQSLTTPVKLPRSYASVEIEFARATAAAANNGILRLWLNGFPCDGVSHTVPGGGISGIPGPGACGPGRTNIDNDTRFINYVRWGAAAGKDATTTGSIRLDDFASQRTGYIGPPNPFADITAATGFPWSYVMAFYANQQNVTPVAICPGSPANYCPGAEVPRDQMAELMIKGLEQSLGNFDYVPPTPGAAPFNDVPVAHAYSPWISEMKLRNQTNGCDLSNNYCPSVSVFRQQMAKFQLTLAHGGAFNPPAHNIHSVSTVPSNPQGHVFRDMPADGNAFPNDWIEQLWEEGLTTGIIPPSPNTPPTPPTTSGTYEPDTLVQQSVLATFLARNFQMMAFQVGP